MSKKQKIIYGIRAIEDVIERGKDLEIIYLNQNFLKEYSVVISLAERENIPYEVIEEARFRSLFGAIDPRKPIAVLSKIRFYNYKEILRNLKNTTKDRVPIVIAVDRVKDPGNIGTIIRTLDAVNAVGFISDNYTVVTNNRALRNASAGAILTFPISRINDLSEVVSYAKSLGIRVAATSSHSLKPSYNLYELDLSYPSLIILGSEERGVSDEILKHSDILIQIPQVGGVESLNVGVAGSVILYEALRQKRYCKPCKQNV